MPRPVVTSMRRPALVATISYVWTPFPVSTTISTRSPFTPASYAAHRRRRTRPRFPPASIGRRDPAKGETVLEGKRLLITGVLTRDSIAYGVAELAQQQGAEVVLTSFGRAMSLTEKTAKRLPE